MRKMCLFLRESFFYCWWWRTCEVVENGWTRLWRRGGTIVLNIRKDGAYRNWSHWKEVSFATRGQQGDIWDEQRISSICLMAWGFDSISCVKFNPIETFLLGSCASDRNIVNTTWYEVSYSSEKEILDMRTNTLCWNPMEAFIFTAANEDYK